MDDARSCAVECGGHLRSWSPITQVEQSDRQVVEAVGVRAASCRLSGPDGIIGFALDNRLRTCDPDGSVRESGRCLEELARRAEQRQLLIGCGIVDRVCRSGIRTNQGCLSLKQGDAHRC